MPLYHRFEDVRVRLLGKVRFTEDEDDENKMHVSLARRLMNEAEGIVEQDLSPRYLAPFQTDSGGSFGSLPLRPTQENLRTLCELKSCIRILMTDFGRGTVVGGDKYAATMEKEYDSMIEERLLAKRKDHEDSGQWKNPPLPSLRLNYFNEVADDGYAGMMMNSSDGPSYADKQINDPSTNYWNPLPSDDTWGR